MIDGYLHCAICGLMFTRDAHTNFYAGGRAVCAGCEQQATADLMDHQFPNDFPEVDSVARLVERRIRDRQAEDARKAQGVLL